MNNIKKTIENNRSNHYNLINTIASPNKNNRYEQNLKTKKNKVYYRNQNSLLNTNFKFTESNHCIENKTTNEKKCLNSLNSINNFIYNGYKNKKENTNLIFNNEIDYSERGIGNYYLCSHFKTPKSNFIFSKTTRKTNNKLPYINNQF